MRALLALSLFVVAACAGQTGGPGSLPDQQEKQTDQEQPPPASPSATLQDVESCPEPAGTKPASIPAVPTSTLAGQEIPTSIDLSSCSNASYYKALGLGSAWVRVEQGETSCKVWIGGETENPSYDGSPSQYCEFARSCGSPANNALRIQLGMGGPPRLDSAACTP